MIYKTIIEICIFLQQKDTRDGLPTYIAHSGNYALFNWDSYLMHTLTKPQCFFHNNEFVWFFPVSILERIFCVHVHMCLYVSMYVCMYN